MNTHFTKVVGKQDQAPGLFCRIRKGSEAVPRKELRALASRMGRRPREEGLVEKREIA